MARTPFEEAERAYEEGDGITHLPPFWQPFEEAEEDKHYPNKEQTDAID